MLRFIPLMLMAAAQDGNGAASVSFPTLSDNEFAIRIADPKVVTVDVRTPEEFNEGHIEGAINIDVTADDFIDKAKSELPADKTIAVYCRSGKRSAMAAEKLTAFGFKVINLQGGFDGWKAKGYPVAQ